MPRLITVRTRNIPMILDPSEITEIRATDYGCLITFEDGSVEQCTDDAGMVSTLAAENLGRAKPSWRFVEAKRGAREAGDD